MTVTESEFAARLPALAVENLTADLRQSEIRYRTLFDLSPVAVYSIDRAGVIQQFNRHAAQLWGRTPDLGDTDQRFCGAHKLFLPDGSFLPHDRSPMARVASGELAEARDAEVVIERSDGSRITVIVNIVPVKDENGVVLGAINCFYDITERSRLAHKANEQAEALLDMHRRKDEFLAMLSHELRNPLAAIANAAQVLRLQHNEDPRQRHVREIIERQVGQLAHLVDDLMEMSRITSGTFHLDLGQINMSMVVERALETTRPLLVQRSHEVSVSLPAEPVWLHADPARLEQVLVNLLTNAAKYTDPGGHIWVAVAREGDSVSLRVRDSGTGIPDDLLPHVFDLFRQADRSLDRSQGGLGIGLSLVKRLVELHGGSVTVSSALGKGSDFVVRLPVSVASVEGPSQVVIESELPPSKSCRVLVVDDNVDAAECLGLLLEAAQYDVRIVHEGASVVAVALDYRPDVVLLDIGLPGLNGFDVARAIRQQPLLEGVLLVALTGYGLEKDRQRAREAGFDHHLIKPTDFMEVREVLAMAKPAKRAQERAAT